MKRLTEEELITMTHMYINRLKSENEGRDKVIEKLDKFLEVLPKYHSWDKYSVINLEFKDQVVCR